HDSKSCQDLRKHSSTGNQESRNNRGDSCFPRIAAHKRDSVYAFTPATTAHRRRTTQGAPPLDIPAEPLGWLPVSLAALCAAGPRCGSQRYKIHATSRVAVPLLDCLTGS